MPTPSAAELAAVLAKIKTTTDLPNLLHLLGLNGTAHTGHLAQQFQLLTIPPNVPAPVIDSPDHNGLVATGPGINTPVTVSNCISGTYQVRLLDFDTGNPIGGTGDSAPSLVSVVGSTPSGGFPTQVTITPIATGGVSKAYLLEVGLFRSNLKHFRYRIRIVALPQLTVTHNPLSNPTTPGPVIFQAVPSGGDPTGYVVSWTLVGGTGNPTGPNQFTVNVVAGTAYTISAQVVDGITTTPVSSTPTTYNP